MNTDIDSVTYLGLMKHNKIVLVWFNSHLGEFLALVTRQRAALNSAIQNAMPPEFGNGRILGSRVLYPAYNNVTIYFMRPKKN